MGEVSLKNLTPAEKQLFLEAKEAELDQWLGHSVFSIARRAGVPKDRIMSMRWVLTWKAPEPGSAQTERRAKA